MQETSNDQAQICTAGVDLSGLMGVLSKHLYSTPMVAVRELVQNAHDSIIRRRLEDLDFNESAEIRIHVDMSQGILRILDTGAGLTTNEIHQYLATVGVGYTRNLREQHDDNTELIGMFGLGFLSAFVLASDVQVITTSYQTRAITTRYRSSNAERYVVDIVEPRNQVGTEVILALKDQYKYLASEGALHKILNHYCALLPEKIYITDHTVPLNPEAPPWRGEDLSLHPAQRQKKYMEFAQRFELRFEPLCTIPIVSDTQTEVQGVLWIQGGKSYATTDNRNLSVFVRGMLLDDDSKDLLPTWAGFAGGVIESSRLTPTASRESLQKDDYYYHVQAAISEQLISGLHKIAEDQPEVWRRILLRHNTELLAASLYDDRLFHLLASSVKVPTSQGDLSVSHLKTKNGKVHVMLSSKGGFEDMLFRALKIPVALGDMFAVLPFLRKWVELKGGSLIELGTDKGNQSFFTIESIEEEEQAWLASILQDKEKLVVARFQPAELPLVVVIDREAALKKRLESDEADKRISVAALKLVRNITAKMDASADSRLFVNLDNPAIQALLRAYREKKPYEAAAKLLRAIKIIMTAGGEESVDADLNGALHVLNEIVEHSLIGH